MILGGTTRMQNYGTIGGLETIHSIGDLPIKNWRLGEWTEGARATTGTRMAETIGTGSYACKGCMVGCGREVRMASGPLCRRGRRRPGVRDRRRLRLAVPER